MKAFWHFSITALCCASGVVEAKHYGKVFPPIKDCEQGVYKRQEWRALNPTQQSSFLNNLLKLQQRPKPTEPSDYDKMVKIHGDNAEPLHAHPVFLPWHRWFILKMEAMTRLAVEDPKDFVPLPYWSWQYDSQSPHLGPVWSDKHFGGNGKGEEKCVQSGVFKDWQPIYIAGYDTKNLKPRCLRRDWAIIENVGGKKVRSSRDILGAFYSIENINSVLARSTTYEEARRGIEMVPHGTVHNNIGGDMRSMYSPNDPIFFLHHANIDKMWADWQKINSDFVTLYNGVNHPSSDEDSDNERIPASLTDVLLFSDRWKVEHVMDTQKLCYTYEDLRVETKTELPPPAVTVNEEKKQEIKDAKQQIKTNAKKAEDSEGAEENTEENSESTEGGEEEEELSRRRRRLIRRDAAKKEDDKIKEEAKLVDKQLQRNVTRPVVVPIDEKVHIKAAPAAEIAAPRPDDQENLNKLKIPPPLDDEWIAQNGLAILEVRKLEVFLVNITVTLNTKVPTYVSPCVAWNRPDILAKLAKKLDTAYAIVNGTKVEVNIGKEDPKQEAADLKERIKKSVVSDSVQASSARNCDAVVAIIGPPLTSKNSLDNPLSARRPNDQGVGKADVEKPDTMKSLAKEIAKVTPEQVKKEEKRAHHQVKDDAVDGMLPIDTSSGASGEKGGKGDSEYEILEETEVEVKKKKKSEKKRRKRKDSEEAAAVEETTE